MVDLKTQAEQDLDFFKPKKIELSPCYNLQGSSDNSFLDFFRTGFSLFSFIVSFYFPLIFVLLFLNSYSPTFATQEYCLNVLDKLGKDIFPLFLMLHFMVYFIKEVIFQTFLTKPISLWTPIKLFLNFSILSYISPYILENMKILFISIMSSL